MVATLCYYFHMTPREIIDTPFPQLFALLDSLKELVENDPRKGAVI